MRIARFARIFRLARVAEMGKRAVKEEKGLLNPSLSAGVGRGPGRGRFVDEWDRGAARIDLAWMDASACACQ